MENKRFNSTKKLETPNSETTVYIDYSLKHKVLEVEFSGGNVYHYFEVEPGIWEQYQNTILEGGSSGEFVNKQIKPYYSYKQIN